MGGALYVALAYGVAPSLWRHHERQPGLADKPMVTRTSLGIPGDALNVGLEGAREDILCAMKDAGWLGVDPVNFRNSAKIVAGVLARRAYATAPVSALYYDGRRQDLAFQKPSGKSPSTRHHVRFWKALDSGANGEPVWLGAATFDRSVGVSHYTGQVTHHIAPDIDAERDLVSADLAASGHVEASYSVSGLGPTLYARNGGGDPYFTDGEIQISRLRAGCESEPGAPEVAANSTEVKARKTAFGWVARVWRGLKF
jgi:hypothetical protein